MKRIIALTLIVAFVLTAMGLAWAMDKALLSIMKRITEDKIVPLSKEPIIANAVKEANKEAMRSQDEINRLDKKWKATTGIDEWISRFLNNPCAKYLQKIQNEGKGLYSEIFVMDKQGCIVAESNKTSDYWQGDEDKFIKSFADGKGDIFIDEPSFDESSQTYSVQISVPILDTDTKEAIGAIMVGINLDALSG